MQASERTSRTARSDDEHACAADWQGARETLAGQGHAVLPGLLAREHCEALTRLYDQPAHFRSTVDMARHGFGRGQYRYFAYPLPTVIQALRSRAYAELAPTARDWAHRLGTGVDYPSTLADYTRLCHAAGQRRPTPLLLRYSTGDHNCLHQDIYGELNFPLQLIVMLSRPGADFEGGELVLVEQRPRRQSRPQVLVLQQGDAAIMSVREYPEAGVRGDRRVPLRHGVATVRSGLRHTLGLIFHDAR